MAEPKIETFSGLDFRSIVTLLIPGLILFLDFIWYVSPFAKELNILDNTPNLVIKVFQLDNYIVAFFILLISLGFGLFLETIRVSIFPWLTFWINRSTPKEIYKDPSGLYERLINRIFIGGNFTYNMTIPMLINPLILRLMGNCWGWGLNVLIAIILFCLGAYNENKFYRVLNQLRDC